MYKGEYSHSIDAKGRITIPAKLRDGLGDDFVITKGFDGCLLVLDAAQWGKIEEIIKPLPGMTNEEVKLLKRVMIAGACDGEVDKQGRMLIPANLREFAGLEKDVIFAGVGDYVEAWDKERYDAMMSGIDMKAVTAKLAENGFSL
ncbi:MAG: division/cell wall cluster transcriptional repressor MraZ [Lachnospiraceae bacterium]|nr:division/cell wall cluster transcriptional repressor MraZ [Lachnospiraceae bacterium]